MGGWSWRSGRRVRRPHTLGRRIARVVVEGVGVGRGRGEGRSGLWLLSFSGISRKGGESGRPATACEALGLVNSIAGCVWATVGVWGGVVVM